MLKDIARTFRKSNNMLLGPKNDELVLKSLSSKINQNAIFDSIKNKGQGI